MKKKRKKSETKERERNGWTVNEITSRIRGKREMKKRSLVRASTRPPFCRFSNGREPRGSRRRTFRSDSHRPLLHSQSFQANQLEPVRGVISIWFRERSSRLFAWFSRLFIPCIRAMICCFPLSFLFLHFDGQKPWTLKEICAGHVRVQADAKKRIFWTTCSV